MALSPPIQTGISIVGRVNNYKLRPTDSSKALFPLFEAVVNSIHAIEEACREDGLIEIYIDRITQTNLLEDSGGLEPIEKFTIIDNGIGFNDEHFKAFLTSDTDYKLSRGGKGIGRFAWLKAFET
ncbi:MAG: ATP-binding protein, partial [Cyanobacteria bacterium P01_A01_bin.137]